MNDPYLLLTPILLLGVIALVGFVGCEVFFPLNTAPPAPPTNLAASPRSEKIRLTWDDYPTALEFHVLRSTSPGTQRGDYPDAHTVLPSEIPYTDQGLVNGTTYFYRVTVVVGALPESDISNEASATPQ